jgi:hypothetical protein
LQGPADYDAADRGGDRSHSAADTEQSKPGDDHDFASEPVGQQAERNLQKPLSEAVDTERLADQVGIGAGKGAGVGRKDRVDHEQAEQPDGKDRGKRGGGAEFLSLHSYGSGDGK